MGTGARDEKEKTHALDSDQMKDEETAQRVEAQRAGMRLAEVLSPRNRRKDKRRERLAEKLRIIADMEDEDEM